MQLTRSYTLYYIVTLVSLCASTLPLFSMNNLDQQLMLAIEAGNVQQVQALITEQHANVNFKYEKYTPLLYAIYRNDKEIVTILLESGADPTVKIADNIPDALSLAIALNHKKTLHKEILKALIKSDQVQNNYSALSVAIAYNDKDIVQALIDAGINLNLTDQQGSTALILAITEGNVELVNMFLAAGADFSLKNNEEHTAFALTRQEYVNHVVSANKRPYQKIGKILLEAYISQKSLRGIYSALRRYFQQQHIPQDVIQHIFSFVPLFFTKHDELLTTQDRSRPAIRKVWKLKLNALFNS